MLVIVVAFDFEHSIGCGNEKRKKSAFGSPLHWRGVLVVFACVLYFVIHLVLNRL